MTLLLAILLSTLVLPPAQAKEGSPLISSFVRSKNLKILRQPHEVEELSGDVRYRKGNRSMRSDWATYDHDTRVLKARGNVVAEERPESGEVITTYGEEGTYNMGTEKGFLLPRAGQKLRFTRTAPGQPGMDEGNALRAHWDGKAQRIDFEGQCRAEGPNGRSQSDWSQYDMERRLLWLKGDVQLSRPDGRSWSDEAHYYRDQGRLVLDGRRPVVTTHEEKYSAAVQADHIEARREPKSIHGEGGARGWVVFRDRQRHLKGKKKRS